jgi:LacI family transcriptional regulator
VQLQKKDFYREFMATRMKDIASAVGVSTVTVSKVLNGDRTISKETRRRVLACAEALQYRTNLAAKGLVTGRSRTIGLIVPEIVHGFFSDVAAGVSDCLRSHGYGLIISSSRDDMILEADEIQQMMARRVDAMIVASCALKLNAFKSIAQELPLVFLDRRIGSNMGAGFVGTDDALAGELATQHLINLGRRSIAYIGGPSFSPTLQRETAYRAALTCAGLPVREDLIVHLPQNEEATHIMSAEATKRLMTLKKRPDAIFCYNDAAAYGAMQGIVEANLKIPNDIALVGCGNYRYNDFMQVPLTSIDQDTAELGKKAAQMALRFIELSPDKVSMDPTQVLIKPRLVVRKSSEFGRSPSRIHRLSSQGD